MININNYRAISLFILYSDDDDDPRLDLLVRSFRIVSQW